MRKIISLVIILFFLGCIHLYAQPPMFAVDLTNPGPIGGATPAAGTFTDLTITQDLIQFQGADVASANALTLGDGNLFDITGTTTINTIVSKGVGTVIVLQFDGILQLTHSNDLFLPTAANITTAAGDIATFYEYASGDWRCENYQRATAITAFNDLSPMTTAGDIIYGGASGTGTRLPDGSVGQYLQTNGSGTLTWAAGAGGGDILADGSVPFTGSQAFVGISNNGKLIVKKTNVADAAYGTSALTTDYIVAWTSLTAARVAVISTEDENSGTTTQPRVMIFKDQVGLAASYPITISLESGGNIDGALTYVINQPYMSVTLYLDGTNAFTMGGL